MTPIADAVRMVGVRAFLFTHSIASRIAPLELSWERQVRSWVPPWLGGRR